MSVVINTNIAASLAARNLAYSSVMLRRSLNRLSSGLSIVTPADDAGGLAVAMKLSAAAHRSAATGTLLANTTSYLQQQDGVMKSIGTVLDRVSELWTLYQDPTKSSSDQASYDVEFQDLQKEIASLTGQTFNGIPLFGAKGSGVVESVQAAEDGSQIIAISAKDLASTSSGVGALADSAGSGSLSTVALPTINTAIDNIASMRATNGGEQTRLAFASEVLTTNRTNLEAAYSQIMDIDIAEESTELARWEVLVDSGSAMLAQANQTGQAALRLIQ